MAGVSTLERIRRQRHASWLEDLRARVQPVAERCRQHGIDAEAVLLFGSRARGDFDGFSDTDLIAVGSSDQHAEALADALATARLGDDIVPLSQESWQNRATSSHPSWRAAHAEAITLWEPRR
jgi:predicted nucleotidyltransferase